MISFCAAALDVKGNAALIKKYPLISLGVEYRCSWSLKILHPQREPLAWI